MPLASQRQPPPTDREHSAAEYLETTIFIAAFSESGIDPHAGDSDLPDTRGRRSVIDFSRKRYRENQFINLGQNFDAELNSKVLGLFVKQGNRKAGYALRRGAPWYLGTLSAAWASCGTLPT